MFYTNPLNELGCIRIYGGINLLSQRRKPQVSSTRNVLTSVFGMETGITHFYINTTIDTKTINKVICIHVLANY